MRWWLVRVVMMDCGDDGHREVLWERENGNDGNGNG